MSQVTPDQLQALLAYASKRLGTTPEQLEKTVSEGNLSALTNHMNPENAAKLNAMVSDRSQSRTTAGFGRSPAGDCPFVGRSKKITKPHRRKAPAGPSGPAGLGRTRPGGQPKSSGRRAPAWTISIKKSAIC